MKKIFLIAASIIFFISISHSQDKGFGLGIMAGEPTGINAKMWVSRTSAFDAGFSWSFMNKGTFHLHADYLWHNYELISPKIPIYLGVGGRIKFKNNTALTEDKIGVRIPVGFDFFISEPRSDIFVEVVPLLDLTPKSALTISGAVGFRFFFK